MADLPVAQATLQIFRGDRDGGKSVDYLVPLVPGMVVLDALHSVQAHQAPDLAVRWNCKAGKCGSCSAEVNGKPRLMCMTRMDALPLNEPITVSPMKSFPVIKDLVTDVSWNYEVNKQIPPFTPRAAPIGIGSRKTSTGCRNSASASSASSARTPATSCGTTTRRTPSPAPVFSRASPPRNASHRRPGPHDPAQERARHRPLQHHQMLHRSLPRSHPHHRQRHHSPQGAGGG